MRLLKVGDITLDRALFLQDDFSDYGIKATSDTSISGAVVMFLGEAKNRDLSFSDEDNVWQERATIDALIALANGAYEREITLTTDNGELRARFDYTKGALIAKPLVRSSDMKFRLTLNFKEV